MTRRLAVMALAAIAITLGLTSPAHAAGTNRAWPTPNLSAGFTPQGMTYWQRPGPNMVVMGEYKPGANSRLVAVNPSTGRVYGQVAVAPSHLGGIAIVGGWLFAEDNPAIGSEAVRRYSMSLLAKSFDVSHRTGHPVYAHAAGLQQLALWQFASFMTANHGLLYAGHHGIGLGARVYSYTVDQATGLLTTRDMWLAPDNTQGMALDAAGQFVFASGGGHLTIGPVTLSLPAHAQGIVIVHGVVYVAFEGGAKYVLKFTV